MSRFKPQMSYMTEDSFREWCSAPSYKKGVSKYITKQYNTYAELKKDLRKACEENIDNDGVHVVRSKRGQWGEWNENWKLSGGKLIIVNQSWS